MSTTDTKKTPQERAEERFPSNPINPCDGTSRMVDHIADLANQQGYATCLREVADPKDKEIEELRATVQMLVDALKEADGYHERIAHDERVEGFVHQNDYSLYCLLADADCGPAIMNALAHAKDHHNITPQP